MNQTTYVLDTSVLLSAGRKALYSFPNNEVVIPMAVLKEVESKRNDPELGLAARSILRELDALRSKGDIKTGVPLSGTGTIRVEVNHVSDVPAAIRNQLNESKIITVAYMLRKEGTNAVLITKDASLRIMADLVSVPSEQFVPLDLQNDFIDKLTVHDVTDDVIDKIYKDGSVKLDIDVPINVAVNLRGATKTALAVAGKGYDFILIKSQTLSGLETKNAEQAIASHYLTNDNISLVSLGGRAGTGKTTLALAAGIQQLKKYKKVTIFRSMHAVGGEELGFLPGTEAEKMDPWTAAIYDSLDSFMKTEQIAALKARGAIEVLPLTHIRGRNLSNRFIIIDEAQNLELSTIMTALSRAGNNTKVVMSWDVSQRDNLRVGRHDGVYEATSRLLGEPLFAHVSLQTSQRSPLAELVSLKLDDYT